MAKNAGIRVPHACLVHDGERRHFASARFDRYLRSDEVWARRHVHTLSGFLHRRASDGGQIDFGAIAGGGSRRVVDITSRAAR
jgi:serine/threonine-protein kinase HipA